MTEVLIVGSGNVGACAAQMLALDGRFDRIYLTDKRLPRAQAECWDLMTALLRFGSSSQVFAQELAACAHADAAVICAAAPARLGQTRNDMFIKNAAIVASIISELEAAGFRGMYVMVTNPVDLLVWYAIDQLGVPRERIVGTGTILDSMRLEDAISMRFDRPFSSVSALALGEHGEGLVVDWDATLVDGQRVALEDRDGLRRQAIDMAYNIVKGKGSTSYGIALAVQRTLGAWLERAGQVLPLSIPACGAYGLDSIALSLPATFDSHGTPVAAEVDLGPDALASLRATGDSMIAVYNDAVSALQEREDC